MFTEPKPKKFPDPVPVDEVSAEKRELYSDLLNGENASDEELMKPLKFEDPTTQGSSVDQTPHLELWDDPADVTEEDKANFIRAILGGKRYQKTYTLFGTEKITLQDRSVDLSKKMYKALIADFDNDAIKITADEWDEIVKLYCLAATYKSHEGASGGVGWPEVTNFKERVELFKSMPRPMYEAIMATSDIFERHIESMIRKAQDESFWPAGGLDLR